MHALVLGEILTSFLLPQVKLAFQESELAILLKRIPLGKEELCVVRDRAEKLRDGKLKSRGDALLPLTLASFVLDALCCPSKCEYQGLCVKLGYLWWHQAITWGSVDLPSMRSCGMHVPEDNFATVLKMTFACSKITLMAYCRTAVTPLLIQWSYCSLVLSHQHIQTNWYLGPDSI